MALPSKCGPLLAVAEICVIFDEFKGTMYINNESSSGRHQRSSQPPCRVPPCAMQQLFDLSLVGVAPDETMRGMLLHRNASMHAGKPEAAPQQHNALTSPTPAASCAANSSLCASPPAFDDTAESSCQNDEQYPCNVPVSSSEGSKNSIGQVVLITKGGGSCLAIKLSRCGSAAACHALL